MAKTKQEKPSTDEAALQLDAELKGAMVRLEGAESALKAAAKDLERVVNGLLTPQEIERVDIESVVEPIKEGDRISGALSSLEAIKESFKGIGKLSKELEQLSDKQRFAVARVHQSAMVRADRERERLRREDDERRERKRREEAERQQNMFTPTHVFPS